MTRPDGLATLRYFDREFASPAVKLLPGEFFVTTGPLLLTTVLGSCVAACVRDACAGIGGMNHFMLPDEGEGQPRGGSAALRYGVAAMEVLLAELLKAGARREHLQAKVFGGGAVLPGMTQLNIGQRNAQFVLRYLQVAQIPLGAQDLGGPWPRRVSYFPHSGRAVVRKLRQGAEQQAVLSQEQGLVWRLRQADPRGRPGLWAPPGAAQAR